MSPSRKGSHSSAAHSRRGSTRPRATERGAQRERARRARPERSPRQRRASGFTIAMIVLGVVAVVAIAAFGTAWFTDFSKKNSARNQLETEVGEVVRVDKVLLSLDESINSKTSASTLAVSEAVLTQIPTAQDSLSKTEKELAVLRPKLRASDRELANLVGEAIEGRKQMLKTGEEIASLDTSAAVALKLVDEGWAKMLAAHEKSDKATESANKGTRSSVEKSLELNREVKKDLAEARGDFNEVQSLFPGVDLSPFMKYLDGRIKANGYAIAGDKATLADNIPKANSSIKKLNSQNKRSAKQLKALEKTPGEALDEQYRVQAAQLLEQYDRAKKETAEIDENVRRLM